MKLALLPLLSIGACFAADYNVGPGQALETIGEVPWSALAAGDTVFIHYRPTPYREKFLISSRGTPTRWIRVIGIPGPSGALPIISGDGAVTSRNSHYRWTAASGDSSIQWGGIVQIAYRAGDDAPKPGYIEIANLQVQDALPEHSFTAEDGTASHYGDFASCIYSRSAGHILVRDNVLTNCGLGFYNWTGSSDADLQVDTVLRGNHFFDNGIPGSYYQHTSYTESDGVVIEYNHFGPMKADSLGSQLKDRSAGTVIRYNYMEQSQGWLIDLVEAQNGAPSISSRPSYKETWVYSNVLLNNGSVDGSLVHWNGDQGPGGRADVGGKLYFYHNTVAVARNETDIWKFTLFSVHHGGNSCSLSTPGIIDVRNNIFANLPRTAGSPIARMALAACSTETFAFGSNWVSPGWTYSLDLLTIPPGRSLTGAPSFVSPDSNDPGFLDLAAGDLHLRSDSTAVATGGPLAAEVTNNTLGVELIPTRQYVHHLRIFPRLDSGVGSDAGAFGKLKPALGTGKRRLPLPSVK